MSSAATPIKSVPRSLGALRSVLALRLRHNGRDRRGADRAVRRVGRDAGRADRGPAMIDFGFSAANGGVIRVYFLAMIVVVAVLALASGARYYLVMTLGERVVADLRADLFAHLTRLDAGFFDAEKTGEIASRLSADTTQLKATFGVVGVDRAAQSLHVRRRDRDDGGHQPQALGLRARRDPDHRPAAVSPPDARSGSGRAAPRIRSRTRPPSRPRALARCASMQSFVAERLHRQRATGDAAYGAYEAARAMSQARAFVTAAAMFLAFGSVVVVLWLGAQDVLAGRMSGGASCRSSSSTPCSAPARSGNCREVWNEVSQAAGAAERIGEILAVKPRIARPG